MHWIIVPAALTLLLASACGPLIELEDENIALRSHVDSLEIVLAECRGQGDLLHERLAAIESENLLLDDRNRELSARVVEMQYVDPSTGTAGAADGTTSPGESVAPDGTTQAAETLVETDTPERPQTPVPETGANRAPSRTLPVIEPMLEAMPVAPYDGRSTAGFDFLRQYQAALNAYNEKQYEQSLRLFTQLLSGSKGNDMTDNCVYWMGEAAVQLGRQEKAIEMFTTVIGYRGADKVDDALLSRAGVYAKEGNPAAARNDLNRLLKDYPDSEHIGIARQMLRNLP